MYQDYKGLYQNTPLQPTGYPNRPASSFSSHNHLAGKNYKQKGIRWNLEETQENISFYKKQDFSSKYAQNSTFTVLSSQKSCLNHRKERNKELAGFGNTVGPKFYRGIKFSNELEESYETNKDYVNLSKDANSCNNSTDLKAKTKSLGYSSSIKDLSSNIKTQNSKNEQTVAATEGKKMTSCKSQKKFHADLDKKYVTLLQHKNNDQYSNIKPYKMLANFLANQSASLAKSAQEVLTAAVPQTQKIRKDRSQLKNYKTWCYKENIDFDCYSLAKQQQQTKQQATAYEMFKQPSSKQILSINDFQLSACKGEGAFGQIFLAVHKPTKMLVAIKRVPKQKVKYMLDQFINEIKIQMFLDHPNLVKLYGFFHDLTYFYIIMEYMQGGSLFCHVKKQKKLSTDQTALRLRQVCLGLKEMHDNSILHRDIKPQNIVITHNVCKLCDFGWSTVLKDRRTTYCGTLDYISPQIVNGQGYDDSVDIWCIGVLAYQLLCGKTPFYNISRTETMKKIIDARYDYPSEMAAKAKSFIDKILKKNAEERLDIDEVLRHEFLDF